MRGIKFFFPMRFSIFFLLVTFCGLTPRTSTAQTLPDIVFVTQIPQADDYATIASTFGNHLPTIKAAPRGGDLYIRYSDGTLKNLTETAGYGNAGPQGVSAIAVRDPAVDWTGKKVLFSMVVGAPNQYEAITAQWQLYEITGVGKDETPVITKVPNQPPYNNIMPVYGTTGRIIFVSDRPRNGAPHLYPQRDEYESAESNTGLWSLNPSDGDLKLLDYSPSGDFHPIVDSYGRIIFTRWDHLQRDPFAQPGREFYGAFDYKSEEADAEKSSPTEVFPEPQTQEAVTDKLINPHSFNQFLPWQIEEDGTGDETLNHIGRHELHEYFGRARNDDNALIDFIADLSGRKNKNLLFNFFHIQEDPLHPGLYYGVDAPEFGTHAAGQIVTLTGSPSLSADAMEVSYVTHRDTASATTSPSSSHSGFYRDPLPLSNGALVAVHTTQTTLDTLTGPPTSPTSTYEFRLKSLKKVGEVYLPDAPLTPGIVKSVSYYNPDTLLTYSGPLWELQPVELRPRPMPAREAVQLDTPEQQLFDEKGISVKEFKNYLASKNLALIVSRNITTRDSADKQQPFNLQVANSSTSTVQGEGKVYEVAEMQILQGDLLRGYSAYAGGRGRRVLARPLHETTQLVNAGIEQGSVRISSDGSVAALVPAARALTWHLTDPQGNSIVKERYWVTFQPGEIRVCTSCHGINSTDQKGEAKPTNPPAALRDVLQAWKEANPPTPTPTPTATPTASLTPVVASPYKLKISKKAVKAASSSRIVRKELVIAVEGIKGPQPLTLTLSVNGRSCPSPIKKFSLKNGTSFQLRGVVPVHSSSLKLHIRLFAGTTLVAQKKVKLPGVSSTNPGKKITQPLNACRVITGYRKSRR